MAADKKETQRDDVDEALEETFPASDAPANTPETGIRIDPTADRAPAEPPKTPEPPDVGD